MLEIETWNALGAKKVDFGNKIYKTANAIWIHVKKWVILFQSVALKTK